LTHFDSFNVIGPKQFSKKSVNDKVKRGNLMFIKRTGHIVISGHICYWVWDQFHFGCVPYRTKAVHCFEHRNLNKTVKQLKMFEGNRFLFVKIRMNKW